jgi:hypothetical protein
VPGGGETDCNVGETLQVDRDVQVVPSRKVDDCRIADARDVVEVLDRRHGTAAGMVLAGLAIRIGVDLEP